MYSSIAEEDRHEVINKCYWPLFKLADVGIPIGIEAPAITLEIINELDPDWVSSLSKYIAENKIEFIGSGYSQIIGPLVPAKVNEWNQKLGLEQYRRLLGVSPKVALVNEMAYSGGIIKHYVNVGYEGIIMEWNNPRSAHPEWENEWRYHPQKAIGNDGTSTPLVWVDSIAFQKFQRYAHGEYGLNEYVKYIRTHVADNERYFPLYSNDVEIFDYRPSRYKTEAQFDDSSEWDRIYELYTYLKRQDWCEFIFPSKVLNALEYPFGGNELQLESPSQPIPVKKQEKYNINRWALTGRDDVGISTKCYQIYGGFQREGNTNPKDWRELCYLWSSDFRTHITEKRWAEYWARLENFNKNWLPLTENKKKENPIKNNRPVITEDDKWLIVENTNYRIEFNKNKGLTIQKLKWKDLSNVPLLGTLDHGYYDDISLGADYYSGHAVIERLGEHKVTDLAQVEPEIIESECGVKLKTYHKCNDYTFTQYLHLKKEIIIIEKTINVDAIGKSIFRPYNFTFNPEAWDNESLYIATHNGGSRIEKFFLTGQNISHGDIYSSLISARHGFGNSEGKFVVGDKYKSIAFECNMAISALIPSIIYKELVDTYFFRLQYSAREIDETIKLNNSKHVICSYIEISIG